jgi:hypothetical protein
MTGACLKNHRPYMELCVEIQSLQFLFVLLAMLVSTLIWLCQFENGTSIGHETTENSQLYFTRQGARLRYFAQRDG